MLVIKKINIKNWLSKLNKKAVVFAPVRHGEESVFEEFKPDAEIDFHYLPTLLSIKEFFLPAEEDIFVFDKKTGRASESPAPKKFILFGLNSRDLEALTQLDEIMAIPNPDPFYLKKRGAATIIGLINEPIKTPPGGDLVLVKINESQYEAIPITAKGKELAKNNFFKNETAIATSHGRQSKEIMPRLRELLYDPELLSDAVKWSWKHDYATWEELGNLCLGCGICAYVCPFCYCFFIEDRIALGGKTCTRCRQWDACTLPRFAQISGALPDGRQGFNFHRTVKERYYNWFFHKFVRAYQEYGKSQCVACGRCQKYCPAKIDIEKYLIRIVENYKKAMGL